MSSRKNSHQSLDGLRSSDASHANSANGAVRSVGDEGIVNDYNFDYLISYSSSVDHNVSSRHTNQISNQTPKAPLIPDSSNEFENGVNSTESVEFINNSWMNESDIDAFSYSASQANIRSASQLLSLKAKLSDLKQSSQSMTKPYLGAESIFEITTNGMFTENDGDLNSKESYPAIQSPANRNYERADLLSGAFVSDKEEQVDVSRETQNRVENNQANGWSNKLSSPSLKRKQKKHRYTWADYSLSVFLLVISLSMGFNLAVKYKSQIAIAQNEPVVAGVTEINSNDLNLQSKQSAVSSEEGSLTQEQFEAWMNEHYPAQNTQTSPQPTSPQPDDQSMMELFGITDLSQLNGLSVDQGSLDNQINAAKKKNDYLVLAKKIDAYMAMYRSFEPYDNQLEIPLNGLTYIAVSEKTGMPIKYLMAISRAESRFGTDRFTSSGSLTRPGKYYNPCSIGLDDSGGNIGFKTWQEGLEACGKWYQYFQAKGVSDCAKWKIFNPNGDYCSKIETLSGEIDGYLKK